MEDTIQLLHEHHTPVPVPLELPDEDLLVEIEEQLLISLPDDYKHFLLEVSDVVCGSLEPATVTDPGSHTYLPELAACAWDMGLPRYLIPICQSTEGYYVISQDSVVTHWADGEMGEEEWPSIWNWAEEVWINS